MVDVLQWNCSSLFCREVFTTLSNIDDGAFCETSWMVKAVYYLCRNSLSQMFDRVLNTFFFIPFSNNKWQKQLTRGVLW